MHVVIAWEKRPGDTDVTTELRAALKGYSWVRPLKASIYIVRLDSEKERLELKDALIETCKETPSAAHLIVSPLLPDGQWSGWLPKDTWPKVRERTLPDE